MVRKAAAARRTRGPCSGAACGARDCAVGEATLMFVLLCQQPSVAKHSKSNIARTASLSGYRAARSGPVGGMPLLRR